jgi:cytochrome b561
MGRLRNTSERFGAPAIALHWAMGLLLAGLIASGLYPTALPAPSDFRFRGLIAIHQWLGYALLALTLVHAAAALRHHVMLGDETLRKMLPGASSWRAD